MVQSIIGKMCFVT